MFIGALRQCHLVLIIIIVIMVVLIIMMPSMLLENNKIFKGNLPRKDSAKFKRSHSLLNTSITYTVNASNRDVREDYLQVDSSNFNTTPISEDLKGITNFEEESQNIIKIYKETEEAEIDTSQFGARVSANWTFNQNSFIQLRRNVSKYFNSTYDIVIFKESTHPRDMSFPKVHKNYFPKEIINYVERLPLQKKCAVVGSSGILKESQCGAEIDAHDFVMRSNYPMIQNFSSDVGSKANFTAVNVLTHIKIFSGLFGKVKNFSKLKGEALTPYLYLKYINDSVIWYLHDNKRFLKKLPDYMANARRAGLNFRIAYSVNPDLHNQTNELWGLRDPSTGLLLLGEAIMICDQINVYGYYPFHADENGSSISHHYWKKVRFNYQRENHQDWSKEFETLVKLHKKGAFKLVTGKCN